MQPQQPPPPPQNLGAMPPGTPPTAAAKKTPGWVWVVVALLLVVGLPTAGCLGVVIYAGTVGPETSVYAANRVPKRFLETAKEVGALDAGEKVRFFYSDGFTDIRDGFYYVSDRRVVAYSEAAGGSALTSMPFDDIASAQLHRDESFFVDSQLLLQLEDGSSVTVPLSSEKRGDVLFFEEVQKQIVAPGLIEQG